MRYEKGRVKGAQSGELLYNSCSHYAKKILADMRTGAIFYVIQEFVNTHFGLCKNSDRQANK